MNSEFPIPPMAKPHEVAIITVYAEIRSARRVAEFLHYKQTRPVEIVLARYRKWLIETNPIQQSHH